MAHIDAADARDGALVHPQRSWGIRRFRQTPALILRALAQHRATLRQPEHRRMRLLALILLTLIVLTAGILVVALIANTDRPVQRDLYLLLIGGLLALQVIAFRLNHSGHFSPAAAFTVACAIVGPWSSILLDPEVLASDIVPVAYVSLSVLLCAVLFSPRVTMLLAGFQFVALLLIPVFLPVTRSLNWPSLLGYIVFAWTLAVVSSFITRQDLELIDRQRRQLLENEARLQELCIRDALTGLYNRRYMEETLDRELQRVARLQMPLGVIMLDIDKFKRFNDAHGHMAGDALLWAISETLRAHVRGTDVACRFGGEEFILILPEASLRTSISRAESLRELVAQIHVQYEGQTLEPVTLSLGVAVFPDHGISGAPLLAAADAALYRAKRAGRNCVAAADEPAAIA